MKTKKAFPSKRMFFHALILSLVLIIGFSHQSLADLCVDDDGTYNQITGACDGTDSCYSTIQSAIDSAGSGEDIIVCSGTYDESITMKGGVDVINEGSSTMPVIAPLSTTTGSVVIFDGVSNCSLNGFDIDASIAGVDFASGVVYVKGDPNPCANIIISNCDIHSKREFTNGSAGIQLEGQVSVNIIGNTIYENYFAGIATNRVGGETVEGGPITIQGNTIGTLVSDSSGNGAAGIFLAGNETSIQVIIGGVGISDNNTISYNGGLGFSGGAGIRLENIDQAVIENNNIYNNTKAGIVLLDVSTVAPHITNNQIHDHIDEAGINIGGASNITIGDNNDIYSNRAGVVFYVENNPYFVSGSASSQPVTITGNDINNNAYAGIAVKDPITSTVIINENDIHQNGRGGIGIQDSCTLEISKNIIRDQIRGGIHTGTDVADGGGFLGYMGSAILTIRQNKVYNNGMSNYGGGIDVRHASGTIINNLVYENHRGGIRFGWENAADDHITDILNNTVVDNGNAAEDKGGGIIYDDLVGAVNDAPQGIPPGSLNIRNNICAYNHKAGIRACFPMTQGSEERDYNLVYANNATGETDCNWLLPGILIMSCANKQYGGCGADWDSYPDLLYPHDMIANPEFEDRDNDDYRIKYTSPAVDAGDTFLGQDVSIPPGVGTLIIDMGAYGGPYGIDW